MKRVFTSSDQVIHLWANQSQEDARCKNVFFHGRSIYSYGRHYELGRLIKYKGKTVAMINDRGYSVTTSKHISSAWHAVAHMPRLKLDFSSMAFNVDASMVKAAIERWADELVDGLVSHFNQRRFWDGSQWESDGWLQSQIIEFNQTCDLLGFKRSKIDVTPEFISDWNAHIQLCVEKKRLQNELKQTPEYIEKREQAEARRQELALEKAQLAINVWRAGGPLVDAVRQLHPQILRVRGDVVETSRGASVPLDHALRLLSLVNKGKIKTGERVGHFQVTSMVEIPTNGHERFSCIKIGCHLISLSEARTTLANIQPRLSVVSNAAVTA